MVENNSIVEHLKEFPKNIDDLENVDVKIEDEDITQLFLSLLPKFFEPIKYVIFMEKKVLLLWMKSSRLWVLKNFQRWNIWICTIVVKALSSQEEEMGVKGYQNQNVLIGQGLNYLFIQNLITAWGIL